MKTKQDLLDLMEKFKGPPATTFWNRNRLRLRQHFLNDDMANFWEFGVLQETMCVGNNYVEDDTKTCRRSPLATQLLLDQPNDYNYYEYPNLLRQAAHLVNYTEVTGKKIKDLDFVVEIGGGFGAMLKVLRLFGFEGSYTVLDFPEFHWLQEIYTGEEITRIDNLCVPCKWENSLLVSMWGLSEFPDNRPEFDCLDFSDYLFAYSPTWDLDPGKTDNKKYFKELTEFHGRNWVEFAIPNLGENRYLIGWKE